MDAAEAIRAAIADVFSLREQARSDAKLGVSVASIKRIQALRFQGSYRDLLESDAFSGASRFFLDELYGERDYSDRDQQFSRMAGTLAIAFPASVVDTAVLLARLHALTEQLDHQMAHCYGRTCRDLRTLDSGAYVQAWLEVGRQSDRAFQLECVLTLGQNLCELTRKPGLSTLLKLMRKPAAKAGLASLQIFLESGFSIFAAMVRSKQATAFLAQIEQREAAWIAAMFNTAPARQTETLSALIGTR